MCVICVLCVCYVCVMCYIYTYISVIRVCCMCVTSVLFCPLHVWLDSFIRVTWLCHPCDRTRSNAMGWLRLVGSIKLQVSFAEYFPFYQALLQKKPTIWSILLTEATPYQNTLANRKDFLHVCQITWLLHICDMTHTLSKHAFKEEFDVQDSQNKSISFSKKPDYLFAKLTCISLKAMCILFDWISRTKWMSHVTFVLSQ